jgi:MazG family protein
VNSVELLAKRLATAPELDQSDGRLARRESAFFLMTPSINRLRQIVAQLRGPEGCPWDREQTHQTLKPHLLEECYEVLEAIDNADQAELKEELGDLLLQVVLHAQFAEEEERFDLDQVADAISEKLIRRHPHVFGENRLPDSAAVLRQWDAIKREEKQKRPSALDGVPAALPALARAQKIQTKAARVGFDWDSAAAVEPKLREEMDELAEATGEAKASELGDLLFTVVNYARKNNLEAEDLLRTATAKFERRFRKVEQFAAAKKKVLSKMTPQGLDNLWQKAKAEE